MTVNYGIGNITVDILISSLDLSETRDDPDLPLS